MIKRHITYTMISSILVGTAITLTSGCGTLPPQERSTRAVESTDKLSDLVHKGIKQNDTLQLSVKKLASANPENLRESYDAYINDAEKLRDIADEIQDTSQFMNDKTEEYFKGWEKDLKGIRNSKLKNAGQERKASMMDDFTAIAESMEKLEEAYAKYERDIDDVESFLGNDLTPAALQLAKPHLKKLSRNSPAIKEATRGVLDGVSGLLDSMNK